MDTGGASFDRNSSMYDPWKRAALAAPALCVGLGVAGPALAQTGQAPPEDRVRALEEIVRSLSEEVRALREEVARSRAASPDPAPAAASPSTDAGGPSATASDKPVTRREVRNIEFEVGETRDRLGTLQSRADNLIPNMRLADGLIIEDPAGRWSLRATARAHFDYRSFGDADTGADTFAIRRARTGLGFTIGRVFSGLVEGEHALGAQTQAGTPAAGALHQAFLDFAPAPWARLRVGQFKPQFGLEGVMTTWALDFQERSLAANLIQAPQNNMLFDRGLMVSGVPAPGWNYGISITNGTGTNVDEFQRAAVESRAQGKDLTARLTGNAAEWAELQNWVLHFGLNYKTGEQSNYCPPSGTVSNTNPCGYRAPAALSEARGITFFNPRPFNNQGTPGGASTVERTIRGLEAVVAWRNVKFTAETFKASYVGALQSGDSFNREIEAGYVAANWLITGEHFADSYRNGLFGRVRPDNQFATGKGSGWGALMAGLRFSYWDGRDFAQGPATDLTGVNGPNALSPGVTQSTDRANAWTVALRWIPTAYTAYMITAVQTNFGGPVVANGKTLDAERALLMRAQFDFF